MSLTLDPTDALDDDQLWPVLAGGAAMAAAFFTRWALERAWCRWRGVAPPKNPASSDVSWNDALLWTLGSGLAVGLARLAARRGVTASWEKAAGEEPPGI